jgi:hypothetical protein
MSEADAAFAQAQGQGPAGMSRDIPIMIAVNPCQVADCMQLPALSKWRSQKS